MKILIQRVSKANVTVDEKEVAEIDVLSILQSKMDSLPLKTAVKEVVAQYGLNKNEVYALALQIKNQNQ